MEGLAARASLANGKFTPKFVPHSGAPTLPSRLVPFSPIRPFPRPRPHGLRGGCRPTPCCMVAASPAGLASLPFPGWSGLGQLDSAASLSSSPSPTATPPWMFDPLGLGPQSQHAFLFSSPSSSVDLLLSYLFSAVLALLGGKGPSEEGRQPSGIPQGGQQQLPKSASAASVEDGRIEFGDFFKGPLPSKLLTLLALLALSRVGIYLPLWGVDRALFQSQQLSDASSLLSTLDSLSGGGIGRLGLFSLGVVPYINAQIVFQLLGTLYPKLGDLQKKEGEAGRKKAQQYTKYLGIGFALVQAIGQVTFLRPYAFDPSPTWGISAVTALTLGSAAVIYIGDKITDVKLGNGTSLLIFTNIVSYLPASIGRTVAQANADQNVAGEAALLLSFLLLVLGIVYVQEAERRIPINYASRFSARARGINRAAYLPFKVNSTGVMPIIFSTSLLGAPASLARFTGSAALQSAAVALYPGGFLYLPANVLLIAFFNYFYTFLQLDPADVSDQLKRQGASIPGVRPGKATATFITNVLARISVLGSLFLGFMAAAPAIVEGVSGLTAFRGFAGTSVLILVGSAADTARKVQAEIVSQKYKAIESYYDV